MMWGFETGKALPGASTSYYHWTETHWAISGILEGNEGYILCGY